MESSHVVFPCDHEKWGDMKAFLKNMLQYPPESVGALVEKLQYIYDILHKAVKKNNVYQGLRSYLTGCHWEHREMFMTRVLPFIVQSALDIEKHKPEGGLHILKQGHDTTVCMSRRLVTCIVACSFLSLWPGRRYERRSLLNSINFDDFFHHCKSGSGQCGKLDCILHYFEVLASDIDEVEGDIVFHRQVLKFDEVLGMTEWTKSQVNLCPLKVCTTGRIEDSGPNVLQVDFANRRIGGGTLARGTVQEEIRFSICPELMSSQLFIEAMTDHEAVIIQGFMNYSDYTGYGKTLKFSGPFPETAQCDALGNLENYLCAIDATSFKGMGGPEYQYQSQSMLRELNKAYIGFKQDFLRFSAAKQAGIDQEPCPMRSVVEGYFSTLSEDIFTLALQETLVSLQESSSSSSTNTHSSGHGQNGRTLPDPLDLMGASVDYARRRSSNLSDISSRRSSSAGSRRSSGTQLTLSECGSELEEYYQAYQARYSLKPSVITEETGDGDVQEFASLIVKNIFDGAAGVDKAASKELEPSVKEFSSQHSDSVVKPKVHKLTPICYNLEPGQSRSSRHKSPVRWREPIQKDDQDSKISTSDLREKIGKLVSPMVSLKFTDNQTAINTNSGQTSNNEPAQEILSSAIKNISDTSYDSQNPLTFNKLADNTSSIEFNLIVDDVPDRIESFSQRLSGYIMYESLRDISEMYHCESHSEASSDLNSSSARHVAGYIGGMMQNVWSHSTYNVRKHFKNQQEQQMWTSDSDIDHDLDVYIYADNFVQQVLQEAVDVYKTEKRAEQQGLENMWHKALVKFETDAKYFEAEFSRYWKNHSPRERYLNPKSRIQCEMLRRRSLDETSRGLMHQKVTASGFRDITLSNFEKELLKSAGSIPSKGTALTHFEQELLNVHPSSAEMLFYSGLRRSSEPAPTHRSSFDAGYYPHIRLNERNEKRRGSSACSTSSREMILDWLNQSQRSSSSSTGSQRRTRTTSSHLDWYAQDLLLEAFNDALKEIFGDVHIIMGGGDNDSVDNSFSSSQSADICDTYIAIPVNSSSSVANNDNGNNATLKSKENIKMEDESYLTSNTQDSSVLLSSTPTEGILDLRHCQNTISIRDNITGAKLKHVSSTKTHGNRESLGSSREQTEFLEEPIQRETGRFSPSRILTIPSTSSPISLHLMEGMCENLSNEVIEGARSSLTTRNDAEAEGARSSLTTRNDAEAEGARSSLTTRNDTEAEGSRRTSANRGDTQLEGALSSSRTETQGSKRKDTGLASQHEEAVKTPEIKLLPIATGNWGCGAYRGDPQLKSLLQWAAASCQQAPLLLYYTFGDHAVQQLEDIASLISHKGFTVGDLLELVTEYCEERSLQNKHKLTLFEYIRHRLDFPYNGRFPFNAESY